MRRSVKDLYCDQVGVKPVNYDFGEGALEKWEPVYYEGYDSDEDQDFGPMMNYYYPLPDDFSRDMVNKFGSVEGGATILEKYGGNVCLVYFLESEEYALALTGGGMDLSWDICETYMLLGYLPPTHFCDLPDFAGYKLTARNKWILSGCKRSAKISENWAKDTSRHLRQLTKTMKGVK